MIGTVEQAVAAVQEGVAKAKLAGYEPDHVLMAGECWKACGFPAEIDGLPVRAFDPETGNAPPLNGCQVWANAPSPKVTACFIGDGIYADHDGYQVWISVGDHRNPRVAALNPEVLEGLVAYARRAGIIGEERL